MPSSTTPTLDVRIVLLPNLGAEVRFLDDLRLVIADDRISLEAVARQIQARQSGADLTVTS